jgi:hypothetical protein
MRLRPLGRLAQALAGMNNDARLAFDLYLIVAVWVAVFGGIVLGTISAYLSVGEKPTRPMLWIVRIFQYGPFYRNLSRETVAKMENASYSFGSKLLGSIGAWFIVLALGGLLVSIVWAEI